MELIITKETRTEILFRKIQELGEFYEDFGRRFFFRPRGLGAADWSGGSRSGMLCQKGNMSRHGWENFDQIMWMDVPR